MQRPCVAVAVAEDETNRRNGGRSLARALWDDARSPVEMERIQVMEPCHSEETQETQETAETQGAAETRGISSLERQRNRGLERRWETPERDDRREGSTSGQHEVAMGMTMRELRSLTRRKNAYRNLGTDSDAGTGRPAGRNGSGI